MAVRSVVLYPDPVLLRPTEPVAAIDDRIRQLAGDMIETMYAAPGIGLAANQVGESLRLFVMDSTGGEDPEGLRVLVNPVVLEAEGSEVGEEGCLSFPDITLDVARAKRARVQALDLDGRTVIHEGEGLLARVMLHEIEHLDGETFLRNVSALKREMVKREIRKRIKTGGLGAVGGAVKLGFLGTPVAAVPALASLLGAGHDVRLVVTQPDRPAGRSGRALAPAVKAHALEHGLAVEQPAKVRTQEFLDRIAREDPDVLVVVAYGRILPKPVLSIARLGAVNLHFSLLPKGRGAAPVQWTLARGEETTGVTTMQIDEKLDEGDILLQREVPIEPGEHSPQLQERLARLGAALLVETLTRLDRGDLDPRPQDHAQATYAPPLRKEDGHADLRWTAREIEGRVRGFDPWPGVWAHLAGRRMRIVRAQAERSTTASPPGSVLDLDRDDLRVACGGGTVLRVASIQVEGRRPITAREALHGRLLAPGDRLEGPAGAA